MVRPSTKLRGLARPVCTIALAVSITAVSAAQKKAKPVFADGQAQVVEAFRNPRQWIQHDLWVETGFDSDGNGKPDRMHVDVTRQRQTDTEGLKVPVIYESSPYFSGNSGFKAEWAWNPRHELGATPPKRNDPPSIRARTNRPLMSRSQIRTWVPRGFAVVHSASPGTGLSQGCPTVGGKNESLAPKAVIDWLNGRAKGYTSPDGTEQVKATWCTGKVGMIGVSYNGTIPLAAATTGVEGLECIIPIAPNTSYYHYYRSNGLIRHPGGYMGEDIDVLYNFINSGDPKGRASCDTSIRDKLMAENMDRLSGDYNDFWEGRNYRSQLGKVRAAALMVHGFNDWNVMPEHSVEVYAALKKRGVPCQAFFHQGGHSTGGLPDQMKNRWFTRYLYGVKNGVEKDPKAWIVRTGERQPTPYADYPNPKAAPVTLYPYQGGATLGGLNSFAPAKKQGTEKLVDDASISGTKLAQAGQSPHRLLFATPKLTKPVHLSGTARIKIRLASSKPAANLSIWMVSLPWDAPAGRRSGRRFGRRSSINKNLITRGWADPQNHQSISESAPLKPGEFYDLSFDLQPDDQIIPEGQQIGLMIFSSDRDFTLWPKAGTELTIDLDATSLTLPVVGGPTALTRAVGK